MDRRMLKDSQWKSLAYHKQPRCFILSQAQARTADLFSTDINTQIAKKKDYVVFFQHQS